MNFLKRSVVVFICSVLLVLSSCTKKESDNIKVLNIPISAKVKGMDPIYASDVYSSNQVGKIYEGLLQYHYLKRPLQLVPNLAAAMPEISQDGLTYTFKILKGVLFHDNKCFPQGKGRELVAEDFVYSIKRLADPKLQGQGWWLLDGRIKGLNEWREKNSRLPKVSYEEEVEGLKAIDKYTIQFKLNKPYPQFLYSLAMSYTFAVPREAVEHYGKDFINRPVGTGPFVLDKFNPQSRKIVYYKNPSYRDVFYPSEADPKFEKMGYLKDAGKKLPLVEKVVVNIMVESQPRWLQFQKGNLDYVSIPKDNFDSVIVPGKGLLESFSKKGIKLDVIPSTSLRYIAFNLDNKVLANKKLRQAMSLAYDRFEASKIFDNDRGVIAESIIPPSLAGYQKDYKNPYGGPDIEKAKKMLAEAGYPGGKGLPELTFDTTSATTSRQRAEYFKKRMKLIGVKIKVITNTWPELNKKIMNRRTMVWGIGWVADYPDAENFLQLLYGGNRSPGPNGSGFNDPKYNEMFEKASVMQDSPERTELYAKMDRMAAEEVPLIYHLFPLNYSIYHGWLENYVESDFGTGREKYLDIDIGKKNEARKSL